MKTEKRKASGSFTYQWPLASACGPGWLTNSKIHFRAWVPHGEQVLVEFQHGRIVELSREEEHQDFWSADIDSVHAGERYRILLEATWNDCFQAEGKELIRRDPYARETDFDSAWCILTAPRFAWSEFTAPAYNELILYELHVGSFPPQFDGKSAFQLTTDKLQHIKALGFNAIALMPVTEFGGIWGYNPRQLLAVHAPWGSADQLKQLIEQAHRLGIAIILDIVLNHGSAKLNTLWNWDGYGPNGCGGIYFEGEKDTPWGRRFAFHKWEVKEYLKAACRMWIEEYQVDGLRFDSVHNMPWHLLKEMTRELRTHFPDKILIAEVTPEDPAVITGAGFDSCWLHAAHFDSLKIMRRYSGGESGHGRISMLKSLLGMQSGFPRSCSGINSVLGSHDQCGDRHQGREDGGIHRYYVARLGGRNNWHARAQIRMWYALQALARGLPMIFMGTETLQDEWWHVDPQHRFNWGLVEPGDDIAQQMMQCVKDANALRLGSCALTSENIRFVHEDPEHTLLAWVRWADAADPRKPAGQDEVLLCVVNMSENQWENSAYAVSTGWGPHRRWIPLFNSQVESYGGWAGSGAQQNLASDEAEQMWVSVPKWSVQAFKLET